MKTRPHCRQCLFVAILLLTGLACNSPAQTDTTTAGDPPTRPLSEPVADASAGVENLSVEAFREKMDDPNTVIVDMRTPEETAQGMIEGAIQIDYKSPGFAEQVAKLDRDKTYLLYCRSGRRSGLGGEIMSEMGFDRLYNLEGGYLAWQERQAQ